MAYWGMLCFNLSFLFHCILCLSDGVLTSPGYKFETLSVLPRTWDDTSREEIEGRDEQVVNNNAQYCSVVRTGIGGTRMVLGGEVDAGMLWQPT